MKLYPARPPRGREHGLLRTREGDEERVALVVDLRATVGAERLAEKAMAVGEDRCVVVPVESEELRRALDVGEEERGGCGFSSPTGVHDPRTRRLVRSYPSRHAIWIGYLAERAQSTGGLANPSFPVDPDVAGAGFTRRRHDAERA
jgi:hypothetical protein